MAISFTRTLYFGGSLIAASAMAASPALAQNEDQVQTTGNAPIVVTAQFREQNLQDTPLSITAIDAALLEARSQTSIQDVANQAPNVSLIPGNAVFGASLGAQIRGVGQFDFNPAYEPGVGLYVDDVYYSTLTGSVFDLLDLERVEVLRGPQGTLTGRNSIGGAIRLVSRRPEGDNSGSFEATYGSRNRIDLRGSADFTLANNLFARVSGVYKEQDGYVDQIDYGCANPGNPEGIAALSVTDNCVVDRLGEEGYVGLRGMVRYHPSSNFDLLISADYTDIDHTNSGDVPILSGNPNFLCGRFCTYASYFNPAGTDVSFSQPIPAATVTFGNRQTFEGWGVSANMDIGLSDTLTVQSITAYREYNSGFGTDDDYTPLPLAGGNNRLDHRFFSQELRLNGEIGDMIEFTLGGYYSDQQTTYYTQQDIRYIVSGLALQFIGNDPVNADSQAVFGTVFIRPTEDLTITGGLRYTEEHKDYTFARLNYDGTINSFLDPVGAVTPGAPGALNGVTALYDGSRVDYRVSLDYRFSPQVLAYATFSTGFKGGGVTARPFNSLQALNGSFAPETLTAYEVGLKTDLFDRRLRLNIAGFYNEYHNVQLPLVDCTAFDGGGGPCGVVTNAGDSHFTGVEVELQAEPIEGLMIDGSLSYLDATWDSLLPAVGTSVSLNDPATAAPDWKFSFGIQYEAQLSGNAGTITPRFDLAYTGDRFAGRALGGVPGYFDNYTLANARLTWRNADDDLSISLQVTNLFNDYYVLAQFAAVSGFTGTAGNQIGRPREWAITVRKTF